MKLPNPLHNSNFRHSKTCVLQVKRAYISRGKRPWELLQPGNVLYRRRVWLCEPLYLFASPRLWRIRATVNAIMCVEMREIVPCARYAYVHCRRVCPTSSAARRIFRRGCGGGGIVHLQQPPRPTMHEYTRTASHATSIITTICKCRGYLGIILSR